MVIEVHFLSPQVPCRPLDVPWLGAAPYNLRPRVLVLPLVRRTNVSRAARSSTIRPGSGRKATSSPMATRFRTVATLNATYSAASAMVTYFLLIALFAAMSTPFQIDRQRIYQWLP